MVLGHAGGWDEFLFFVVPIVVALAAIRWAGKRARRSDDAAEGEED
ncbi:MAG: hypothetical protein R3290_10930 [Acidimicrobiia bacterium]|nr:hypothetical protein [Acidimicrobiia bacterium]